MVMTRKWIDDFLSNVLQRRQNSVQIDLSELLGEDVSRRQIQEALETAEAKAGDLGERLEEVNEDYDDILEEIEEAESEAEAKRLKREAGKLKKEGNKLDRQHSRWIRREQSLHEICQEIEEFAEERMWEQQHGEVFTTLEEIGVGELQDRINEQRSYDREILDDISSMERRPEASTQDVFAEVDRDLAEKEWSSVEEEGSGLFGSDLLEDELTDEEFEIGQEQGGMAND